MKQSLMRQMSFVSEGLAGRMALTASSDGIQWNLLESRTVTAMDRLVVLDPGAIHGKYLRLQFALTRGGVMRAFQVVGRDTDASYTVSQSEDGRGAPVNFADGIGGGRLIYSEPMSLASRGEAVIRGRIGFAEAGQKTRIAIYDLGESRSLREFSSVHSPRPVRFAVYAFDHLPEKEDWRGRLSLDPAVLENSAPVAVAEDRAGVGFILAKPQKPIQARYIALCWEPDFNPPAFAAYTVSISGYASIHYSGDSVSVTTSGDGDGGLSAILTVTGRADVTITIDAAGHVTVSGSAADGDGSLAISTDGQAADWAMDEPLIFNGVVLGAPSAVGAGFPRLGVTEPLVASPGGGGVVGPPLVGGGGVGHPGTGGAGGWPPGWP